ncbi:serine hydrolase domain-containing protein [Tessaracoccus sp. Z1128]
MTGRQPIRAAAAAARPPRSLAQWIAWIAIDAMASAMLAIAVGREPPSATPAAIGRWASAVEIEQFAQRRAEELDLAGLALVVLRDGEPAQEIHLGSAGEGRPVTGSTPFVLGSTSKQFTALAVHRLIDGGLLSLDRRVADLLPGWASAPASLSTITVRDLLGHTSGLSTTTGLEQWGWQPFVPDSIATNAERLADAELVAAPGSAFEYSNSNYDLLGAVIEQVTGMPFAQAMTTLVAAPMSLAHTTASPVTVAADEVAAGHYSWLQLATVPMPAPWTPGAVPSAFQVSTADDLTQLLRAHLGTFASRLPPETLASARAPLSNIDGYSQYGSGWVVRPLWEARDHAGDPFALGPIEQPLPRCIDHLGGTYTSQSYLLACPTTGFGLVALTNTGPGIDTTRWARFTKELTHVLLGTTASHRLPNLVESNAALIILGSLTLQALTLVRLLGARRDRWRIRAGVAAAVAVAAMWAWWTYSPRRLGFRIPLSAFWAGAPELGLATIATTGLAAITLALIARQLIGAPAGGAG